MVYDAADAVTDQGSVEIDQKAEGEVEEAEVGEELFPVELRERLDRFGSTTRRFSTRRSMRAASGKQRSSKMESVR